VRNDDFVTHETSDGERLGAGWHVVDGPALAYSVPTIHWGNLGVGWEYAEEALALVQADLTRTVADAPTLGFAWQEDDGRRVVYVGKGPDWYFGGNGGLYLGDGAVPAVAAIAEAVQDAIVDNLLGYRTFWPRCPDDGGPLSVRVVGARARWLCDQKGLVTDFGEVGQLRLAH